MPEHEPERYRSCAICERTILRGERVVAYLTPDGETQGVCALCRDRAEAAGWVRADSAAARAGAGAPRRRRGLGARLRERAANLGQRARRPKAGEVAPEKEAEPRRERRPEQASDSKPAPKPKPAASAAPKGEAPERRLRRAIARFNDSEQSRIVAGLMRSLGEPQAAVRDLSSEPSKVEVTIAWELSWYRWEVSPNGEGAVRETAKGTEISELGDEELDWNAAVDGEGNLRWDEGS